MVGNIALIVTAIGVLGVVFGLRQSYRERLRQFEAKYVDRYWKILDQLSLEAIRGSILSKVSESDEKAIRSYISLCEDELEMRHYGYIADDTYEMWAEGIKGQLARHPFKEIWKKVQHDIRDENISKYTYLHDLMTAREVKAGNHCDPLKMNEWQRTLRGLRGFEGI